MALMKPMSYMYTTFSNIYMLPTICNVYQSPYHTAKMTMLRNDTSEECEYNIGKYKIYFLCR